MKTRHIDNQTESVMSGRMRYQLIVTGCVVFGSSFLIGWGSVVESALVIIGAIVQPRSPRPGKWLIWIGSLLMSAVVLPFGIHILFDTIKAQPSYHDVNFLAAPALFLFLVLLVLWCDIALVVDEMRRRHEAVRLQPSRNGLDWVVWIVAFTTTSCYLWTTVLAVRPYQVYRRVDVLGKAVAFTIVTLLFDVALVVHAIKSQAPQAE